MIQKAHLKKWLFPILLLVAMLILPNAAVFGSDVVVADEGVVTEVSNSGSYTVTVNNSTEAELDLNGQDIYLFKVGEVTSTTPIQVLLDETIAKMSGISDPTLADLFYDAGADKSVTETKKAQTLLIAKDILRYVRNREYKETQRMSGGKAVFTQFNGAPLGKGVYLLYPNLDNTELNADPIFFTLPFVSIDENGQVQISNNAEFNPKVERQAPTYSVRVVKKIANRRKDSDGFIQNTSYTFGIYSEDLSTLPSGAVRRAQGTVTISAGAGEAEGVISGLRAGTYYIYELDASGNPILDTQGRTKTGNPAYETIIGIRNANGTVTTGNSFTVGPGTATAVVEVTNSYDLVRVRIRKVFNGQDTTGTEYHVVLMRQVGNAEPTQIGDPVSLKAGETKELLTPIDLEADRAEAEEVTYSVREIFTDNQTANNFVIEYSSPVKVSEIDSEEALDFTVTNTPKSTIAVQKRLYRLDENEEPRLVSMPQGIVLNFKVGLFDSNGNLVTKDVNGVTTECIEDLTIDLSKGQSGRAVFQDVPAGTKYQIYELEVDANGNLARDASGKVVPITMSLQYDENGNLEHYEDGTPKIVRNPVVFDFADQENSFGTTEFTSYFVNQNGTLVATNEIEATQGGNALLEVRNVYPDEGDSMKAASLYVRKVLVDPTGEEADTNTKFYVRIYQQAIAGEGETAKPEEIFQSSVELSANETKVFDVDLTDYENGLTFRIEELDKDGNPVAFGDTFEVEGGYTYRLLSPETGDTVSLIYESLPQNPPANMYLRNNEGHPLTVQNVSGYLSVVKEPLYDVYYGDEEKKDAANRFIVQPFDNKTFYVGLFKPVADVSKLDIKTDLIEVTKLYCLNGGSSSTMGLFFKAVPGETYILAEIEVDEKTGQPLRIVDAGTKDEETGFYFDPVFVKSTGSSTVRVTYDTHDPVYFFNNIYYEETPEYPFMSGELVISKNVFKSNGTETEGKRKFWAGIYLDKDFKQPAPTSGDNMRVTANPVELDLTNRKSFKTEPIVVTLRESDRGDDSVARVNLYVTEVVFKDDGSWVPVQDAPSFEYTVTYGKNGNKTNNGTTVVENGKRETVVINNTEVTVTPIPSPSMTPPGITPVITVPPRVPVTSNYTHYESYAVTQDTVGTTTTMAVVTGDDTPIALYVGILAAAGILIAALVVKRKRG